MLPVTQVTLIMTEEECSESKLYRKALGDTQIIEMNGNKDDKMTENENDQNNEMEVKLGEEDQQRKKQDEIYAQAEIEKEAEKVDFDNMARKVLQQVDDVMSTAVRFDSSTPLERMGMLRRGLELMLRRNRRESEKDKEVEVYEEWGAISESVRERGRERERDAEVKNRGVLTDTYNESVSIEASTCNGGACGVSTVRDFNDTMQLLMTIIGNAKVREHVNISHKFYPKKIICFISLLFSALLYFSLLYSSLLDSSLFFPYLSSSPLFSFFSLLCSALLCSSLFITSFLFSSLLSALILSYLLPFSSVLLSLLITSLLFSNTVITSF